MIWKFVWCILWTQSFSSLVRAGERDEHEKPAELPSRYEPLCLGAQGLASPCQSDTKARSVVEFHVLELWH